MKRKAYSIVSTLVGLGIAVGSPAQGAITWVFDYSSAPIFAANANGEQDAVNAAAAIVSAVVGGSTTIQMAVTESNDSMSSTLASASSAGDPTITANSFSNRGVVGTKILTGVDGNGPTADGTVDTNFGQPWSFTNTVGPAEYDFISTMAHELLHAVGFDGAIFSPDASNVVNGEWGVWDEFLADNTGRLVNPTTFVINSSGYQTAAIGRAMGGPLSNGLFFDGPNANAANGGNPVPLHSSSFPYSTGSTAYHLEDEHFTGPTSKMMNAATDFGLGIRTISDIEKGILQDLGFTIVPEPSSAVFLIASMIGLVVRRRR